MINRYLLDVAINVYNDRPVKYGAITNTAFACQAHLAICGELINIHHIHLIGHYVGHFIGHFIGHCIGQIDILMISDQMIDPCLQHLIKILR